VTLNSFELCYGLKVNFLKSGIGGLGIDQTTLQRFATILNCEVMTTKRHDRKEVLVRGCHKRGSFWGGVFEKLKSKLGRWKGRFFPWPGGST